MLGLITDRTQNNVDRITELHNKGWSNLTDDEKQEWLGDPFLGDGGANLFDGSVSYSDAVAIKRKTDSISAIARQDGSYLYAVVIVGEAAKFTSKTFTLSVVNCVTYGNVTPQISAYWHDGNGFDYAGASLSGSGEVTFTTDDNPNGREYLALYVYVATETPVVAGDFVRYEKVMLERGSVRHEYVPYSDMLSTPTTKGAYNYSDLNRVERAVNELADSADIILETKTDWTMWDIPKKADMDRYLGNITKLRSLFPGPPDSPTLPGSMNKLNYMTANNIEKIIGELEIIIDNVFRCNEIYCGEV